MRAFDHSFGVLSDGHVLCRKGGDTQGVVDQFFVSAREHTPVHDAHLASVTDRLNALLKEAAGQRDAQGRSLAILDTPDGLFLAWTRNEHDKTWDEWRAADGQVVLGTADDQAVREALRLRPRRRP